MCGRFGLPEDHESMIVAFDITADLGRDIDWDTLMPRFNVAPTDQIPVIFENDARRCVAPMRWGLLPPHAARLRGKTALDQNGKSISSPVNARSETVHSKAIFKRSFETRRCLIPVGGFYEWKRNNDRENRLTGRKVPHWIHFKDRSWMGFAGLYTWWKSPDGQWLPSCTIVTTVPNSFMEPIHNRMPVILTEESYDLWLDRSNKDLSLLKEMLVPCPVQNIQAYPVSSDVNKSSNQGAHLIDAV